MCTSQLPKKKQPHSPVERRIEDWKQRLIDLTRRNRLLYFKPAQGSGLAIEAPAAAEVFQRLAIAEKPWTFWIPSDEDEEEEADEEQTANEEVAANDADEEQELIADEELEAEAPFVPRLRPDELYCGRLSRKKLEQKLKNIYRKSHTDYQERGVRILHVALGTLQWKENDTSHPAQSPLILCPVELERETARDPYYLSLADEDIVLNPALAFKLRSDFRLELPALPEEWEVYSLEEYFDKVADLVQPLGWTVEPSAQLGLFSFHKLAMYQDLAANGKLIKENEIIRSLAGESAHSDASGDIPELRELDAIQRPEDTFQILDADSSQQQTVQAALRGKSLVLQGPPGTGKSQTIANVIAEFIARGKTVLFVSEKMAALEVVYKRLHDAHLGDFCLELHSHKANKREVVAELKRCLDEALVPQRLPTSAEFEKLKELRQQLNDYVLALHEVREPLGESVREALGRLAELDDVPLVPSRLTASDLLPPRLRAWEELIKRLGTVWPVIEEGADFPWRGCQETRFTIETRAAWTELLKRLAAALAELQKAAADYAARLGLAVPQYLADIEWLIQVGAHLKTSPGPDQSWLTSTEIEELFAEAEKYGALSEEYWQRRNALAERYEEPFFALPPELAERLERSWQETSALLLRDESRGRNLIARGQALLKFAEETPAFVSDCQRDAEYLALRFELPATGLSLERAKDFAHLALLSEAGTKPDPAWLERERLQQVRALVAKLRPEYEDYNRRRAELLANYDESFLELDLDQLIENFGSFFYRSFLRFVSPGFRRDKRAILRASRSHALSGTVLEDLLNARELARLKRKLDGERAQVTALLGGYDKGYDTDFAAVERALGVADEVIRLARPTQVSEGLKSSLCYGSVAPPELSATGRRLRERIEGWEERLNDLSACISAERLPGTDVPLKLSPLSAVAQWATALAAPLRELNRSLEQALPSRKGGPDFALPELLSDLRRKDELRDVSAEIDHESSRLQSLFGERFRGVSTQWREVLAAIEWTRRLRALFGQREMPPAFIGVASQKGEQTPAAQVLAAAYRAAGDQLAALEERFTEPGPVCHGAKLRELSLTAMASRVGILHERVDELQPWTDYRRLAGQLEEAGLTTFLAELHRALPPAAQLLRVFRKSVYEAWLGNVFEQDRRLGDFRGRHHEQLIKEFQELDSRLVRLSSQRIVAACVARRPRVLLQSQDNEISLLRREAAKKKRHLPVRHLFDRLPNLLLRLKPCLLMSPLSVSQFLQPNRIKFDLVIFDEASQIFTEDAVGSIYRGAQLIVAGDSKQLPPTDFFKSVETDEESDEDALADETSSADFSSVLDECGASGRMAQLALRWHYRSRHESLIAFSNHRFYNNKLVTFPSAQHEHRALGVELVHLPDGVYDRGGKRINRREAEVIAERVFEHFARHPQKSIGVVAFSQAQMIAIEDEIDRRRLAHPEFEQFFKEDRLEGFFVKNLENVQGDERDVIVFSIGYGYDQKRRMTMNFGPLNRAGGERRLNVAVTRAREKVLIISSITAADIKLSEAPPAGVLNLYHYLDYAARGATALELSRPQGMGEPDSPLEVDVAGEIRSLGYEAIPQVGCSGYRIDIGVLDPAEPGRFLLGVECDGATYHSAATARDRDRLRQQVLEKLGWRIHRIWSPDWVTKRGAEIRRLKEALEETHARPLPAGSPLAAAGDGEGFTEEIGFARTEVSLEAADRTMLGAVPYQVQRLGHPSLKFLPFHDPLCQDEQCQLLAQLVSGEGPLHIEVAARRLASLWGLQQVGARIMRAFDAVLALGLRRKLFRKVDSFLWPADSREVAVRVPVPQQPETIRDIEHISPEEIHAAMALIVRHAVGIGYESLLRETARLFGFNRLGDRIRGRLEQEFKTLKRKKRIAEVDGAVSLAEGS